MSHILYNTPTPEEWAKTKKEKQEKEKIISEKRAIIAKELSIKEVIRPTLDEINLNDNNSIFVYIAKHNLACAMSCCGELTSIERVQEIIDIIKEKPTEKYFFVNLYPDENWEKIKKDDNEEALEYFQIFLKDQPQDANEQKKLLAEFREIYNSISQK